MSVYNGAEALPRTLESILAQQGVDLEFIVIDDGSTDASGRILDDWAGRDARLRVIHQANTGLTRALIRGCAEAQGEFIARQDCGDISLPRRLEEQVAMLQARPEMAAVSCHTVFVGPKQEPLFAAEIDEAALNRMLAQGVNGRYAGPSHHGSMMFRRGAYEAAGGYRAAFHFAQDLDLWTRLIEQGPFAVVARRHYEATLDPHSISGTQTREQQQLAGLIDAATQARRSGADESSYLAQAAGIRPAKPGQLHRRVALGNYFIGSCLRRTDPRAARDYFRQALANDPWLWRARLRWLQVLLAGAARA